MSPAPVIYLPQSGPPSWIETGAQIVAAKVPVLPDLVQGLLPPASKVMLLGATGSAKTLLALELLRSISIGSAALGHFAVGAWAPTFFVEEEHSRFRWQERVRRAGLGVLGFSSAHRRSFRLDDPSWLVKLGVETARINPAIVALDPLPNLHGLDENSARDMGTIVRALDVLHSYAPSSAQLVLHHVGKMRDKVQVSLADLRGSTRIAGALDVVLALRVVARSSSPTSTVIELELSTLKHRDGDPLPPLRLELTIDASPSVPYAWRVLGHAASAPMQVQAQQVLNAVASCAYSGQKALAAAANVGHNVVSALAKTGTIKKVGGVYIDPTAVPVPTGPQVHGTTRSQSVPVVPTPVRVGPGPGLASGATP